MRCTPWAGGQGAAESPGVRAGGSWSSSACPRSSARAPVPERYHEATKLLPGEGAARRPSSLPEGHRGFRPGRGPEEQGPHRARSWRRPSASDARPWRFAASRPPSNALAFALKTARGHAALERAPGVDLQLAVHRVAGLDSGVYRYESAARRLVLLRRGDLSQAMIRASIGQKMAGEAAVGFLMLGRIAAAVARGGERSYRDLLVEAGAIGQRVYLAAEAAGLAARNLAAFRGRRAKRPAGARRPARSRDPPDDVRPRWLRPTPCGRLARISHQVATATAHLCTLTRDFGLRLLDVPRVRLRG